MLIAALALSFFGMFIMFYSLSRDQDRLIKFVNKKHTEFFNQLMKIEEIVSATTRFSDRSRVQAFPQVENLAFSEQQVSKGQLTQNTVLKNVDRVVLDDVFPTKNTQSEDMLLENVFTLQPDMTVDRNDSSEQSTRSSEKKSSILELLQL